MSNRRKYEQQERVLLLATGESYQETLGSLESFEATHCEDCYIEDCYLATWLSW